ncbi:MAG TPA: NAD(P)-dependent oxidoreductase [Kofleriaceae bacterium]|nr:NAD(P)-dependent oxidoreductase [Kofleriaceae bacterium]
MILVTGGMGFIGLNTARALVAAGESCVLGRHHVDRMPDFLRAAPAGRVHVEPLDVGDPSSLRRIGERHAIDGIIHLAAHLGSGDPVDAARDAFASLVNVLEVARAWRVKRVSLASTIGVYAGLAEARCREDAALPVASPHFIPAVKKCWEVMASHVGERIGVEVVLLRLAGLWGPLKASTNALPSLLAHAAVRGDRPDLGQLLFDRPLADDGYDMCYVEDGARAIALLHTAAGLSHRIYNVGSGRATRNQELIDAVKALVPGFELELPRRPAGDAARELSHLDIARLRQDTGYTPSTDVAAGMAAYIAWLRAGNPW